MSNTVKASFKAVSTAPIIDAETGKAEVDVSAALAAPQGNTVSSERPFFGGEEDEDASEIRHAWVNLVQPTSAEELKKFGVGNFVLKGDTNLGNKFRCVVVGFSAPTYEEKVKWGAPQGKVFKTLEEVAKAGGTTRWSDSIENRKIRSDKAYYDTQRKMLVLIEKPEQCDDARFYKEIDGKLYSPALFFVKGMSYETVYVFLKDEQRQGLLRQGFSSRTVEIYSKKLETSEALRVCARVLEPSSPAVISATTQLRS